MRHLKNPWVLAVLVLAGIAGAGTIKNWSIGEVITAAQLNQALNHIHTNMVGGHGARLINADVSGSAAIASSKLADGEMIPWAKVSVGGNYLLPCTSGTCDIYGERNVESVERTGAGTYTVTFSSAIVWPVTALCTLKSTASTCTVNPVIWDGGTSNTVQVITEAESAGALTAADKSFSLVVWNDGP